MGQPVTCCFMGSREDAGHSSEIRPDGRFQCTRTADWRVEYSDLSWQCAGDVCADHLDCVLSDSAANKVTAISQRPNANDERSNRG